MYKRTYSVEYTMDDRSEEIPVAARPDTIISGGGCGLGGLITPIVKVMAVAADSEDDAIDAVRKDCEKHEKGDFRFRSITYKGTILL